MACSSEQANTQPALLSELTGSLCDDALDAGAVCCSSLSLDKVEQELKTLANSSSQCFAVRQRIQCAEACDPERTGWWDPTAGTDGVAYLCDSLCEQLYTFCYQVDGQTLSYPNRNVAEFCATHTGVNRSHTNSCLGLGPLSTGTTPTVTVVTTITSADLFTGPVSAPTVSPGALSASPSPPTEEADGPGTIVAVVVVLVVLAIVCAGGCWVWNNKSRERPRAQTVPPPRGVVPNKPQPSAALVARRESELATAATAGNRRLASGGVDSTSTIGSATSVDAAIAHHTAVVAGTAAARARAAEERAVAAEERAAEAEARAGALEDLARQGAPPEAARAEAEAPPRYTTGNSGGSCTAAAAAATAEERRSAAAEGRRAAAQRRADAAGSQELRAMEAEGGGARGARASSSSSSPSCGNAQAGSGAEAVQDGGGKWGKVRRGGKAERGEGAERQPSRLRRQVSDTVSKIGSRVQTQQMAQEDARKQEARLQKAKQEAARRIKIWQEKHRDIYSLLESLRGFGPPLFPKDPLGGATLERNARSLRKAYHKCAARLHPDKVHGESVQARALAEELFKALGEAYAAESSRLEAVDNALSA
jgi:hypothetical protein